MHAQIVLLPAILASLWLAGSFQSIRAEESTTKCTSCQKLVKDFIKGKERTARENFAGGDVSWEEEKRLSYATSETRLIEIMEGVCTTDHKCQHLVEENEELVETWWFGNQKDHPDLHKWLCIQSIKVCCPNGTYGKKCRECPGGAATPCSGQGQCHGDGDRKGKGTCSCGNGYAGKTCGRCAAGHFADVNSTALRCAVCSTACEKNCTGPSAGECEECADGYEEEAGVCLDQDECGAGAGDGGPCGKKPATFCRNTAGSYECAACHAACKQNCSGGGADLCAECADGYRREDAAQPCQDVDECKDHQARWLPPPRPDDPSELYPGCNFTTYCANTEGSYECLGCAGACDGCKAGGRESCLKCATGYTMQDTTCSDADECGEGGGANCDAELEACVNTDGSFRCDCVSGRKRVDGACPAKPAPKQAADVSDDDDDDDDELSGDKDEL